MRADGRPWPRGLCRHCRRRNIRRPRRLCGVCFYTPAVRALYPPMGYAEAGRMGGLRPKRKTRP